MEDNWQANPPPMTAQQRWARTNPEYATIKRNLVRWRAQLQGRLPMGRQTVEGLKHKIGQALSERKKVPCSLPRRTMAYCRYADDYLILLCSYSKPRPNS